MSRFFSVSALLSLSTWLAIPAFANDSNGVYVNLGVTQLSTDLDLTDTDLAGQSVNLGDQSLDINMITGRIGYRINDFIAVEGEAGFGLGGDDFDQAVPVDVLGTTVNVDTNIGLDVNNYYIGFVRGIVPVSEQVELFGRVGYGAATAEADIRASAAGVSASGSVSEDIDGFAYGIGAQYNLTHHDGIRLDFTRLDETNIFGIAYARRF